jgi:hypothetical protein
VAVEQPTVTDAERLGKVSGICLDQAQNDGYNLQRLAKVETWKPDPSKDRT